MGLRWGGLTAEGLQELLVQPATSHLYSCSQRCTAFLFWADIVIIWAASKAFSIVLLGKGSDADCQQLNIPPCDTHGRCI